MTHDLIKTTARIFGGSAVAGMGLSLGRDVYRGVTSKDKKNAILGYLIIALAIFGTYIAGVWISRNYESFWGGFFKRIGALFVLTPSFLFLLFIGIVVTNEPEGSENEDEPININQVSGLLLDSNNYEVADGESVDSNVDLHTEANPNERGSSEEELSEAGEDTSIRKAAYILPFSVLIIGLQVGVLQRKKRRMVWEAEKANRLFMQRHGLYEHEDSTIEDTNTGQNYRIDHLGKNRITLFPLGRRGKRAYIRIGEDGKYSNFTGMIAV